MASEEKKITESAAAAEPPPVTSPDNNGEKAKTQAKSGLPPTLKVRLPPRLQSFVEPSTVADGQWDNQGTTVRAHNTSSDAKNANALSLEDIFAKDMPKSPPNMGNRPPRHQRGVSWDVNVGDNEKSPIRPPLLQPVLAGGSNTTSPSPLGMAPARSVRLPNTTMPPRPPMMTKKSSRGMRPGVYESQRNFDRGTEDLAHLELEAEAVLMELEAETMLMKDLDERDPMRPRAGTGNSVLSQVPVEQLAHDFRPDGEAMNPKQLEPHPSTSPPGDRAGRKKAVPQTHRRQLTVEETLFGLTSALSAMNHSDKSRNSDKSRRGLSSAFSKRLSTSTEGLGNRERADTGDRLTDAANLLFNRMHVKTPSGSTPEDIPTGEAISAAPAGQSKWSLLREHAKNAKKTDAPSPSDIPASIDGPKPDLEQGNAPSMIDVINEDDDEDSDEAERGEQGSSGRRSRISKIVNPFRHLPYADAIKEEWESFNAFLAPRKHTMYTYAKMLLLYVVLPCLGIAAILFYLVDNPPTGRAPTDSDYASASWWLIFIGIREVFIFCMAKCAEVFLIDFLSLQTRATLRTCGPLVTLMIVQSKGWPCLLFFWGVFNFALVAGSSQFSNHWLYWQDWCGLFNEANPSGTVTSSLWFIRVVSISTCVGIVVAVKRVTVGIALGRKTFSNYSKELARVMKKMLHVSEVAGLAKDLERRSWAGAQRKYIEEGDWAGTNNNNMSGDNLTGLMASADAEDAGDDISQFDLNTNKSLQSQEKMERVVDLDDINPYTGALSSSQKARISEILGSWEEPARGPSEMESISIGAVLQFRRALAHMDTDFPFSAAFGLADTREACIASAQEVYDRLLLKHNPPDDYLHFDTIAALALRRKSELDSEKAKDLIRTFRPDRDGVLTLIDFVRSVDAVYKELRMLRANVASSSKIDQAIENIINVGFYVLMVCVILSQTGFDPLALFLSMSSIILAFAFMIGSASAKYFEGLLFILVQRPYSIGDRVNASNPETESNVAGAQGWIIDNVTLFTTTVYMAATNERATISNGSLAKSRIINGARSPKAILYVTMKFGIETPYKKVEIFRGAVEKFVKARPREWLSMLAMRVNRIEADLGFIEYSIVLQHRESWQNVGSCLNSRHIIHSFCLELAKKLDMRYKSPPLPIDLNMNNANLAKQFDVKYDFENVGGMTSPGHHRTTDDSPGGSSKSLDVSEDIHYVAAMFDG